MADTPTAPRAAAGEPGTRFIYLLNAMERAAQAEHPAKEGYAEKRRAVLQYVESRDAELRAARGCRTDPRAAAAEPETIDRTRQIASDNAEGETTVVLTTKPGVLLGVKEYNALREAALHENEASWIASESRYCVELLRDCPATHPSRPLVDEYVRLVVGGSRGWFSPGVLERELEIAREVDATMRANGEDPTDDEGRGKRFRELHATLYSRLAAQAEEIAGFRVALGRLLAAVDGSPGAAETADAVNAARTALAAREEEGR